jgi:Hypothetical protein (DUF2513)
MDLIRKIILAVESHPDGFAPQELAINGCTADQVNYHIWLMGQGGLLQVVENTNLASKSPSAIPISITWEGHEFAAASKSESVWSKTKTLIASKGGGVGFEILKALLMAEAKRHFGIPLG